MLKFIIFYNAIWQGGDFIMKKRINYFLKTWFGVFVGWATCNWILIAMSLRDDASVIPTIVFPTIAATFCTKRFIKKGN